MELSTLTNSLDMAAAGGERKRVVFNNVPSPDKVKAYEVEQMEKKYQIKFPHLKRRFHDAEVFIAPADILQTILQVVECMLLPVRQYTGWPALVIIGVTGAGKSTFGNWLLGKEVEKVTEDNADEDDDEDAGVSIKCANGDFTVGAGRVSKTFAPNVGTMSDGTTVIDFPGFSDTSGFEIRIGMDLAFRCMVDMLKPAHVIASVPIGSNEAGRGTQLRKELSKIRRLLPSDGEAACQWMVGITECDKDFVVTPKRKFNEIVQEIEEIEPALRGKLININKHMFVPDAVRAELKSEILKQTTTPCTPNAELNEALEKCFPTIEVITEIRKASCWKPARFRRQRERSPSQEKVTQAHVPYPTCLISDCLSEIDTKRLEHALSTHEFAETLLHCDERAAIQPMTGGETDWSKAKMKLQEAHTALRQFTDTIKKDSENLLQYNILSVERRSADIHQLCSQRQCRLKSCFVELEGKILKTQMQYIKVAQENYKSTIDEMAQNRLLRPAHCNQVRTKLEEVDKSLLDDVQSMGYKDWATFATTAGLLLGRTSASGGVGLLLYVSITSTTLQAGAASGIAMAGLATGGALLLVAAISYGIYHSVKKWKAYGDKLSTEMKDELISGMQEIMDSHRACTAHIKRLGNLKTSLRTLEVLSED